MKKMVCAGLAILFLTACGGTSSTNTSVPLVNFSRTSVGSSVEIAGGISNEGNYTYDVANLKVTGFSGYGNGQKGAKISVNYDSSQQPTSVTLTSAGGTTTTWNSATDTFGVLRINNSVGSATSANGQNYSLVANPYDFGWNYQTFGTWVTGAGTGSGTVGNYSVGVVSTASEIPTTGSGTYIGSTGGRYSDVLGNDYFTSSDFSAAANFATRSVSLTSSSTATTRDLLAVSTDANLDFTGTMIYSAGTNNLSGIINTTGGSTGNITGQFYGPAAEEIGGTFSVDPVGVNAYIGAFGAKKIVLDSSFGAV
jgi:hypothetical protein